MHRAVLGLRWHNFLHWNILRRLLRRLLLRPGTFATSCTGTTFATMSATTGKLSDDDDTRARNRGSSGAYSCIRNKGNWEELRSDGYTIIGPTANVLSVLL